MYEDGALSGTFAPAGTGYQQMTATFTASVGAQVLKFVGRNTAWGDNTAFVDDVRVTAATGGGVKWLLTDHLGPPRMVVDESGALAGVRWHDYLPFGEEIIGGGGGSRTDIRG